MKAVNPAIFQSFSFPATITAIPILNVYDGIEFEWDILKIGCYSSILDAQSGGWKIPEATFKSWQRTSRCGRITLLPYTPCSNGLWAWMIEFEVLNPCQFVENGKQISTNTYDTRKSIVLLITLSSSDVAVVVCYSSLLSKIHVGHSTLLGYNLLQH